MCKRFSVIFIAIFLVWFLLLGVNRTFAQEPEENIPEEEVQQEEAQPAEAPQPEQPEQPVEQPQQQVEQPPQPEAPPPPPPPPVAKPKPPPAPSPTKRGEVSFNFDDADVYSVIQTIFGDILRVNYIVDPTVKGRVTFRSVAPIAREDVLPLMEVILRLNGIAIAEEGGLYRIIPLSDIPREPAPVGIGRQPEAVLKEGTALVQVVPIHYIQSSEMVRVLTPFLSKNAVIVDVPKSNYIIIVDTDANVKRLLQLVEIFDSEQLRQITPKVFVYPVQNSKAKDVASLLEQIFLGAKPKTEQPKTPAVPGRPPVPGQPPQPVVQQPKVVLGEMAGEAVVSENTKIIPDEVTNSIIVLATPEDYKIISETIELIDILPRQVVIEGLIARVDLTDNLSFGFTWSMRTDIDVKGVLNRDVKLGGDIGSLPTGPTEGGPISGGLGKGFTFVATDPSGIVRARLEAALLDSKAKIMAAPHILVSDNREARIQVGSQIPLATSTTTTIPTTGTETVISTPVTSSIQYKDIGIILKVKPQVNDSGLVSLEITQEVSSQGPPATIAGQDYTSIQKTEAATNLVAQDGETIIIGGLIREDTTKSKDGIPLLSNIPIIGNLFSSVVDNTTRTELIILLTPHVMRSQQEAGEVSSTYIDQFKKTSRDKDIQKFIRERGMKSQEPADGRNGGPDDDKKE